MLRNRQGFTLIELLIVVVIIGILAAIAIPKFGQSREKAYVSAMQSDLRQLMTAQEIYYSNPANEYKYASDIDDLNISTSSGVEITIETDDGPPAGWNAVATHAATNITCDVFFGESPGSAGEAEVEGVITCSDGTSAGGAGG